LNFGEGVSLGDLLLFHVVDECEKRNLHVPIISFDGQWYRVLVRDSNGYPPTKLQLQNNVFAEEKKTSISHDEHKYY
jgi:hypothetical protein